MAMRNKRRQEAFQERDNKRTTNDVMLIPDVMKIGVDLDLILLQVPRDPRNSTKNLPSPLIWTMNNGPTILLVASTSQPLPEVPTASTEIPVNSTTYYNHDSNECRDLRIHRVRGQFSTLTTQSRGRGGPPVIPGGALMPTRTNLGQF